MSAVLGDLYLAPAKITGDFTVDMGISYGNSAISMVKLWNISIINGKTMENQHFQWENYGKSAFSMGKHGKTMEDHHTSPFSMGKLVN